MTPSNEGGHHGPRLLFLSHSAQVGGAVRSLAEFVDVITSFGWPSPVVVLPQDGPIRSELRSVGATVRIARVAQWAHQARYTVKRRVGRIGRLTLSFREVLGILQSEAPDAVVTNTLMVPEAALASRALKLPHFWFIHEFPQRFNFTLGYARSMRIVDKCSSGIIANSTTLASDLAGIFPSRTIGLVNYVVAVNESTVEWASPDLPFRVLVVGRVGEVKRQLDVIQATEAATKAGADMELRIVGRPHNTEYYEACQRVAHNPTLSGRVGFFGESSDMVEHYAWAHVVVVASISESFGRVTIEAMKLGRPVFAAKAGASQYLVEEGVTGKLFPPRDTASLSRLLLESTVDLSGLARMGEAARLNAQSQYNFRKTFSQLDHALTGSWRGK